MSPKFRVLPYVIVLLPFDLIVGLCLFLLSPLSVLVSRRKSKATDLDTFPATHRLDFRATIVVVNWDGRHLLAECLPAVAEAVRYDGGDHEILVVDNGSTDGSVEFIREHFPSIRILVLDKNYGFSGGNNRGVSEVRTDIIVLLNNDMIVDRAFLGPLLRGFSDPSVFAVTSQIFFADSKRRREETGKTRARFEHGFFYLWHDGIDPQENTAEWIPVFWAGGGSCAIDRRKYVALGGFDSLYHPFYVEDTDLSYQAWKRGWKSLLAPASRVIHKHRSTSAKKFGTDYIENTVRKNQYLFVWKNVTDPAMILEHVLNLPRIHGRAMLQHPPRLEVRAFFRAFRQLPEALRKRLHNLPEYSLTDRDVLARSQTS